MHGITLQLTAEEVETLMGVIADAEAERERLTESILRDAEGYYTAEDVERAKGQAIRADALRRAIEREAADAEALAWPVEREDETGHEHAWEVVEEGYAKVWRSVEVDFDEGDIIVDAFDADMTDEGSGERLVCYACGEGRAIPADWKLVWKL